MSTVFSGGTYINTTIAGDFKSLIMANMLTQLAAAGWTNIAYASGGVGFADQTFTVTIAVPGVVTLNAHGLSNNDPVVLRTTGALPTGLSANTKYFVRNVATNTFELSTTSGGASITTTGSQSGTHKVSTESILLKCAADPTTGNRGNVRLKDNLGTCVQVSIENISGSKVSTTTTFAGGNLLPAAAKVFRILASKYRFEVFTAAVTAAREFVCAGILWIPAPYQGVITEAIYMQCNSTADGSSTLLESFRTKWAVTSSASAGNFAFILNGALLEQNNDVNSYSGAPIIRVPAAGFQGTFGLGVNGFANCYRWHDLAFDQADALFACAIAVKTDEALIRGQVYDWTILSEATTVDATDSWTDGGSSHSFYCLMSTVGASNTARGSIWVAYS